MTVSRNNQIAAKLRELADLFHGVADVAPLVVPGSSEPAQTTEATAADEPKKRGRPAKADAAPAPTKSEPVDNTTIVTADHPKRAELVTAAKAYAGLTSMGDAQKAMKLFGESSKVVPDCELQGAIQHFKNLSTKLTKPAPAAEDESI